MPRRKQIAPLALIGLLLLFVYVLYSNYGRSPEITPTISSADERFTPLEVENPALRFDKLDRLRNLEYEGSHRNIFSATLPPPPAPPVTPVIRAEGPIAPPPPPPLVVPATFFGYVADTRTGTRRACFSQGDEVVGILGVGEVLLGRFRLIQIGNNSVQLEEIASGRQTTLVMQEQAP